jgi:hypothetical protein
MHCQAGISSSSMRIQPECSLPELERSPSPESPATAAVASTTVPARTEQQQRLAELRRLRLAESKAVPTALPGTGSSSSSRDISDAQLLQAFERLLASQQQRQQQQESSSSLSMSLSDWSQQQMQNKAQQQQQQQRIEGCQGHAEACMEQHAQQQEAVVLEEQCGDASLTSTLSALELDSSSSSSSVMAAGAADGLAAEWGGLPSRSRKNTSGGGSSVESHPIDW